MFFVRYDFPLPNNGDRYDFSQEELHKLLDSVYERGYTHGVEATNATTTVTASYKNGPTVSFTPRDADFMWNSNNNCDIITQAIDEIHLLENILKTDKHSDSVYNSFRKEVCVGCRNADRCLQSKMAIIECPKFENYYEI